MATTIVTVPRGRGKSTITKPWAKTVTRVEKNATSGHDYTGEWLTQGAEIEAEIGDVIAVQDGDGDGVAIHVLVVDYVVGDADGQPTSKPGWVEIVAASGKSWASKCAVMARKFLAMSPEDSGISASRVRREEIEGNLAHVRQTPGYAARYARGNSMDKMDAAWWIAYYERLLARYDAAPVSPLAHISTADLIAELTSRGVTL